jgi:hypothetical protein
MGMMNPIYGLAVSGGMGAMGGGFFDPRSSAMSSMAMGFGGLSGLPSFDPADQEIFQVAIDAAGDVAREATGALEKSK